MAIKWRSPLNLYPFEGKISKTDYCVCQCMKYKASLKENEIPSPHSFVKFGFWNIHILSTGHS